MNRPDPTADQEVDALYRTLRDKHGAGDSKANGYVTHGYFLREQEILFGLLNPSADILLDLGCGSGLMCKPLVNRRELVVGLDFNKNACEDAQRNGLQAIRGDAFELPICENSVQEIVCCQFFNQQNKDAVAKLIEESARVLRPGGRLIMIWRNGEAYIHRGALFLARIAAKVKSNPQFPYENHSLASVVALGRTNNLVAEFGAVSFPPTKWVSNNVHSLAAKWVGASSICILRKN